MNRTLNLRVVRKDGTLRPNARDLRLLHLLAPAPRSLTQCAKDMNMFRRLFVAQVAEFMLNNGYITTNTDSLLTLTDKGKECIGLTE